MTKDVAGIIYNKMTSVAEKFFKANPLKRFPDDFLSIKTKRELEGRKSNPTTRRGNKNINKSNPQTRLGAKQERGKKKRKQRSRSLATIYRSWPGGQSHQVRHRLDKIDFKKVMESYNYYKKLEDGMKYEVIALPEGKFELKIDKKIQICAEKWPMPLEFDSFDKAKYVLYSRGTHSTGSGQAGPCVCNLPLQFCQRTKLSAGVSAVLLPKDETIVKKAVQKYEKYLKKMRDKLVKAFMERNVDKELAEAMVKQVFPCKIW